MEELGGLFANLQLDDDEIRQDLERIYAEFCRDPDCELKLNKPHMWYASPVIDDYYFKREKNLCNLTWIRDVLTLRFFHARNSKVDVKLVALNLGDPIILKELGLLYFTDVGEQLTKIQRLQTLAKEMRDISYIVEMVKMDDVNLLPIIRDSLKERYNNEIKDKDYNDTDAYGIYMRYAINIVYSHYPTFYHHLFSVNQIILMFSVEVGANKIYARLSSLGVTTTQIYYAMAYSNRIHAYNIDFKLLDTRCLETMRDLSVYYGSLESFNILQSYIISNLPEDTHNVEPSLCYRSDMVQVYPNCIPFHGSVINLDDINYYAQFNAINIFRFVLQHIDDKELSYYAESDSVIRQLFKYHRLEMLEVYLSTLESRNIKQTIKSFDHFGHIEDVEQVKPLFDLIRSKMPDLSINILCRIEIVTGLTSKVFMDDMQYMGYQDDKLGLYKWIHWHASSVTRTIDNLNAPSDRIINAYKYYVTYRDDDMQKKILLRFNSKLVPLVKLIHALDDSANDEAIKKRIRDFRHFNGNNEQLILAILADYDRKDLFERYLRKYDLRVCRDLVTKFTVEDDVDYLDILIDHYGDGILLNTKVLDHMVEYNSYKVYRMWVMGDDKIHFLSMYHLLKYKSTSKLYKYFMQGWKAVVGNECDEFNKYEKFLIAVVLSGNMDAIKAFIGKFTLPYAGMEYLIYRYSSPEVFNEWLNYITSETNAGKPTQTTFRMIGVFKDYFMLNYKNAEILTKKLPVFFGAPLWERTSVYTYKKGLELTHKYLGFAKSEITKWLKVPGLNLCNREYLKSILEDGVYFENL